jgi:hypothetical protein
MDGWIVHSALGIDPRTAEVLLREKAEGSACSSLPHLVQSASTNASCA